MLPASHAAPGELFRAELVGETLTYRPVTVPDESDLDPSVTVRASNRMLTAPGHSDVKRIDSWDF